MSQLEAQQIVAAEATVADKIRALDRAGHSRAEIARLLGKRYQHVRNVLEADRVARDAAPPPPVPSAGMADRGADFAGAIRLVVDADGALRLPPEARGVLGMRPGQVLIAEVGRDRVTILNAGAAMARLDAMMAPLRGAGLPLASEELIADRRIEAADDGDG